MAGRSVSVSVSVSVLLVTVLFLAAVGMVMLTSTCVFSSQVDETDVYREAKRQVVFLGLGGCACMLAAMIDYRVWRRHVWLVLIVTSCLLAFCFVPGLGLLVNGERRWIRLGGLRIQPSELAKLSVVFFLAFWYARYPDCGRHLWRGFLAPLGLVSAVMGLILFEVDIGTTAVIGLSVMVILFVAGVNWVYLASLALAGLGSFVAMLVFVPGRMERIIAFLNPEAHRLGAGFQQWISLMAIGSGGLTGRGLGEGRLKMLYMPFAHTDFIFPMIGEELGLLGTLSIVLAFMLIVWAGMSIAFNAPDRFGLITAVGLTALLATQAFINIGVTSAMLPNTGLPLPFVSYGGSSLVVSFAAVGILINVYRQGRRLEKRSSDWGVSQHCDSPRF